MGSKPITPEDQKDPQRSLTMPNISHEHVMNQPETNKLPTIPKRIRPSTFVNRDRWNTSTHVKPNSYLPNLADNYPRDPFTKMPPKRDAIEIYRLLQSIYFIHTKTVFYLSLSNILEMTVDDVKKFLGRRKEPIIDTTSGQQKQRPVVYAACHVDDIQTLHKPRKGEDSYQQFRNVDESGLHLTDDARKSVFFRQLAEVMEGGDTTAQERHQAGEEKAKWALFTQYGTELIDFLKDRHGRFKRQYDKVFIT